MSHRTLALTLVSPLFFGLSIAAADAQEQPTKRPTDEARGQELYKRHCEACHGAWNKGHGPATQALVRPVPDLEGRVVADDRTIQVVMRGRGAMPGYEQTFDRFDAKRVLEHMAKLKQPPQGAEPARLPDAAAPTNPTPAVPATPPVNGPPPGPAPPSPAK